MLKAELFWHRIALASEIFNHVNTLRRKNDTNSNVAIDVDEPIFKSEYSAMIWDIVKMHKSIRKVCSIALHDAELYGFDVASSIDGNKLSDEYAWLSILGDYARLKQTKLLKHLYHVVFFSQDFSNKVGANMPALLLVALLHDFGKHKMIAANHKSATWLDHEEISANYARHIMKQSGDFSPDFIDAICSIISTHHKIKKEGVPLRDYLNRADAEARRFEGNVSS